MYPHEEKGTESRILYIQPPASNKTTSKPKHTPKEPAA
jgi:hypothetical protein